jgi:3-hydroxyisobutyrate dehydrogenase-like beta-hydroxyacid dehydrogenase
MSASPRSTPIGFLGLGAMGARMSRRLLAAGHDVLVHDVDRDAAQRLVSAGATACSDALAVADDAEIVLVSLPTPEVVVTVAEQLARGSAMRLYVDLSTTGPQAAEQVAELMARAGVGVVDAPVSGGAAGAEQGRLTIMAAGQPSHVERARPLLEVLGSTIFVVGDLPGQGQSVKVINNLMSACSIAITSEAAMLGVKAGVDPKTLLEVVSASSGANAAASSKFPQYVLTRSFHQGFRLELMAKDVRLALAEARRHAVPMVLGSTVEQLWNLADASLEPAADFMEIVQMFERWSGTRIESPTPADGGVSEN